jgi:putative tryptophan/tyrosine transport system substrate-binding protein
VKRREFIVRFGGAAVSWSAAAGAQQPMPVIGYLGVGSPETDDIPGRLVAFRRGLHEAG